MSPAFTLDIHDGADLPCILFDTNVVLDVFLAREPFLHDSKKAIESMISLKPRSFIAASSLTDLAYVLQKNLGSAAATHEALEEVLNLFDIADTTAWDVYSAHANKAPDFEDNLIAATADRIGAKYIVTRNVKDFKVLIVKVVTPHEFLKLLE
ncbi:MAG: PIN domain-containing protein [Actinomycetia bacterium]|nr:PIN domain-containing protein [Actinomycetes bacterium]